MISATDSSVIIKGVGAYTPAKILTNDDLAKMVDTSDEWIHTRTGIRQRYIADETETTSVMATKAAEAALENAGLQAADIELIVVGTATPDMPFPSVACLVQKKLKTGKGPAFDIEAACSGFIYVLDIAAAMMRAHGYKHALIIGAEKMSNITNWEDRATCVLFGDGAGAAVLSLDSQPNTGLLNSKLGADGSTAEILQVPPLAETDPEAAKKDGSPANAIQMQGKEVFKSAVKVMCQSAIDIISDCNLSADDIDLIIPHQANNRIIEALSQRLGVEMERFFINVDRYGNTSAASIPIALAEAYHAGRIKSGDKVLMVAFGGGLTWASALIQWQ